MKVRRKDGKERKLIRWKKEKLNVNKEMNRLLDRWTDK